MDRRDTISAIQIGTLCHEKEHYASASEFDQWIEQEIDASFGDGKTILQVIHAMLRGFLGLQFVFPASRTEPVMVGIRLANTSHGRFFCLRDMVVFIRRQFDTNLLNVEEKSAYGVIGRKLVELHAYQESQQTPVVTEAPRTRIGDDAILVNTQLFKEMTVEMINICNQWQLPVYRQFDRIIINQRSGAGKVNMPLEHMQKGIEQLATHAELCGYPAVDFNF